MPLLSFLASLWQQLSEVGWLQWLALLLGVSEVLLARANKIALYPAGIAASAISMYILWVAGLYGESVLNLYYVVMSIYGWWFWHTKRDQPPVKITKTNAREWWVVAGIVGVGYALLYLVLSRFTDSTVPHLDSFVTVTAWAGMWLLARRKLENWILLNISNAVAIPLLYHKGLLVYALLTAFLFVVAVQGYFSWRNKMNKDEALRV
jgi:nicotinamide mononucleotide transporter